MARSQKSRSKKSSSKSPDVFDILRKEHKNVKSMLKSVMDQGQRDDEAFLEIDKELQVHMAAEEKHLYPELENAEETRDLVLEAYEEHNVGKEMIEKIKAPDIEEDVWLARVKVLTDVIEHHIEEEEGQMFKKAKSILDSRKLEEIKRLVKAEKSSAMGVESESSRETSREGESELQEGEESPA